MNTTTTQMMQKAIELGGREWIGRAGQHRVYLNGWAELAGLSVIRYKSGNISSADYNGEHVSNTAAESILFCKAYVDADGLHVETAGGSASRIQPQMIESLSAMLTEEK